MASANVTDPDPVGSGSGAPQADRLTAVRDEIAWMVLWLMLAATAAIIGFAAAQPTATEVLVAVAITVCPVLVGVAWSLLIKRRLRRTFREPLATVPREPATRLALRGMIPLGGLAPSLVILLSDGAFDGTMRAVFCGLVVGVALLFALQLPLVVRAERAAGGPLLYQRRPTSDNLWRDQRALSRHIVYLVDDPDPDRWGEHRW